MRNHRMIKLIGIAAVFSLISGAIVAHLLGPRNPMVDIRDALRGTGDTRIIELRGDLQPIGKNRFVLTDPSGQVVLETYPVWYRAFQIPQARGVEAVGMLASGRDRSGNHRTHFQVYRLRLADGTQFDIRPLWGKPPWLSATNQSASLATP